MAQERKYFRYCLRRSIVTVPQILLVVTFSFFLIHLAPGDPIIYLLGGMPADEEFIAMMREKLGLNQPLYLQFVTYIGGLLRGDLGYSHIRGVPVSGLILERVPATFLLLGLAWGIFSTLGVLLGVMAVRKRNSPSDYILTSIAIFGYCMPSFWMGLVAMYIFGFVLGWFPLSGMKTLGASYVGWEYAMDVLRHAFLPVIVMGVWSLAITFRVTRQSVLETLQEDFIVTSRAKGLKETTLLFKHALKNSLRPILTIMGVRAGAILAGAVVTETVFAWPGMGRLMYEAVTQRDYPLLLGGFVFTSFSVIIANFIVDILYGRIDPRVSYE